MTTSDGRYSDVCHVTVKSGVPITAVILDVEASTIGVGDSLTLGFTIEPTEATWDSVTWTSSDPSVAKVDDGKVTGISEGTVTITVSVDGVEDSCTISVAEDIEVTGITLDITEANAEVGGTLVLQAEVVPSNATDKTVIWTTSDSKIAKVSDGTVTMLSEGTVTITAITQDGGYSATCTIDVTNDIIEVTGVTLDREYASFAVGDTLTLQAEVTPSNATDKTVVWTTSDSNIATVVDGTVTGVSMGSVVITATTVDGSYSDQCSIDVIAVTHVTGVSLNKTTMSMTIGDSASLKAVVSPSDATDVGTSWSSSDKRVATVSDGVVKAISSGTATITVTTNDGGFTATCTVTVGSPESGGDDTLLYIGVGIAAVIAVLIAIMLVRRKLF